MISLGFVLFSLIGFGMGFYHYLRKDKILNKEDLVEISGKISELDISSFGKNARICVKLNEYPKEIFLTDNLGYLAIAKDDLRCDVKIGDTVFLNLRKDSKVIFDVKNFYELKTNQKWYLTIENYNLVWQKYHTGNLRLGVLGGVICLIIAVILWK